MSTTTSMQLTGRVERLRPSATLGVSARVKTLREQGKDVIDFGTGEPDFDTPVAIKRAAIDALEGGMTGYQPVPGTPAARAAIARKLSQENGIACSADDIVITVGAKNALSLAMLALVEEGREVVLPTPAWVSYRAMVELAGGTVVEVPGALEHDLKVTPDALDDAITPRTAVVILNSPSNPCGTMYTPDEIRAIVKVVLKHDDVAIVSDEIYEHLIYGDVPHLSPGSIAEAASRVVTINGLSKAYAMTGWRLGYVCAPGDGGAVANAIKRLQSQTTSHATAFCYPAIVQAIEHGAADVERMRRVFAERAELIHGLLAAMPGVACPKPVGAFYAFPDVSAHFGKTSAGGRVIESSIHFAQTLLDEALVGVVPGDDFGVCARSHVRISFACNTATIEEGCRRIAKWIRTLD